MKKQKKQSKQLKVIGELRLHPDGYGFVISDSADREDVFVPARFINNALHTDLVEADVQSARDGRFEGRIIRIVERRVKRLIGRLEKMNGGFRVVTDDKRVRHTILISKANTAGAKHGQNVVVEILKYPEDSEPMRGRIFEVLGLRGDVGTEERAVVIRHQLRDEFPADVKKAADEKSSGWHFEIKHRKDLRAIPFVTIDGETARDFDDAVAVKKLDHKGFRLWVSIADVSYFVTPNDPVDSEAYERSTSVYFPKFCIPMLPEVLSNDLCSLVPGEDRLTMTAELELSSLGEVLSSKIYPSVIRSQRRLTYTQVKKVLVEEDEKIKHELGELVDKIRLMEECFKPLRKKRTERGSIDFDLPEPQIVLDVEGGIDQIVKAERHVGHMIIEEFMIAANEAVARYLTEKGMGCVYRVHARPERKKLFELSTLLHNLGYRINFKEDITPMDMSKIVKMIHGKPEERLVNHKLLRSLPQAVYSPENVGHFGLASKCYCHFTSPIRRYPDLVVHRLLKSAAKHPNVSLKEVSEHCSRNERIAMAAEREMLKLHSALFMSDKIGMKFKGIISFVAKFGFFVELEEYFIEGLVRIEEIEGDRYRFEEESQSIVGRNRRNVFKIGYEVAIELESVDIKEREIIFKLVTD